MKTKQAILKTFRFSENLTYLSFLLSRHKFSSIALATVVNFNEKKREKKKIKIGKSKCFEYILITAFLIISQSIFSQANQSKTTQEKEKVNDSIKNWKISTFLNVGINGSLLFNWTAGGESNLALQSIAKINADYTKDKISLTNELDLIYGLGSDHNKLLVKQSDLIQLESELNYSLTNKFHLSLFTHLTTQFSPGFLYSESDTGAEIKTRISSFLSPGLSHEGIGINMIGTSYEIGLAPIAMQQTIVIDSNIDSSIYGVTSGDVKNEFGTYLNANTKLELLKNKLAIDADMILFIPYNDFSRSNFLFKYLIEYKISKVFSINSSLVMLYDDDIGRPKLVDTNFNGIPDSVSESNSNLQLKQVISLGVNYSF